MTREEAINRLNRIAEKAVHTPGETPFVMSLDDEIAVHMAVDALKGAKGDCISRQAAIDALKGLEFHQYMEFGEYIGEDTREVCLIRAEKAQDALQNLPSAQPEQRWIPCEERLPEMTFDYEDEGRKFYSSSTVLISTKNNEVALGQFRHIGGHESYYVMSYLEDEEEVLAWMPLPKVYKKEGETDDRLNQQGRR